MHKTNMQTSITNEIIRVCQILNKNDIQYLIVSGNCKVQNKDLTFFLLF
jgi:3-deoxy-D-arabino-heptulosonate 7-phosphate (DAHP) synthase